jgi:hypothetical protein
MLVVVQAKQMLQRLGIFLVGAVLGGAAVGWYFIQMDIPGHWDEREAFIQPAADVSGSITMLERLHVDDTETAIEMLEHSLDGGLVGLSVYESNEVPAAEHHLIQGAMRQATEYRSRHPRTNDNPEVEAAIAKALSGVD